jgi:NADPH-dependent 2,4-dienoyl-CoA reductase/sulfur reductase-like enzyme
MMKTSLLLTFLAYLEVYLLLALMLLCSVVEMSSTILKNKPHVGVIGGGFGGWGAAKALCEAGCKVTLLDAGDPAGKYPLLTKSGKPFEAGNTSTASQ